MLATTLKGMQILKFLGFQFNNSTHQAGPITWMNGQWHQKIIGKDPFKK
jgi:hypothetical protein